MRTLPLTVLAMSLLACGPSGSTAAIFRLVNAGEGPFLVTHIDDSKAASWLYLVSAPGVPGEISHSHYLDPVQLPEGPMVSRYITDLQIVFQEQTADGKYYWGSSSGDVLEAPLVELSYPLRLNRTWTTGNENFPDWYQFSVDGVDEVETPAGHFTAARLLQFNSRENSTVTRWYVERVGMVQRFVIDRSGATRTTLLSFQGESP